MQYSYSLSRLDCPLNPSLEITLDQFQKASKNHYQQWINHRGGKRRGGRIKRKGRIEFVQHKEERRGHKTGEDG